MSKISNENNTENVIEDIIITHFINPSMFWYRVSPELPEKLFKLEQDLQKHFSKNRYNEYIPKKDEIVGVYIISESRCCRARVEEILEFRTAPKKYMLWALDYGKVYSTNSKFIRELPQDLVEQKIENIFFGGLNNIVPAKQTFDFRQYANVMKHCEKWSSESCKLFDEAVKDAYTLEFVIQRKIKDQFFGELKASIHTNNKISINDMLIKSNGAMETDKFVLVLEELKLNQRPFWLTNENDINKYNQNTLNNNLPKLNNPQLIEKQEEPKKPNNLDKQSDIPKASEVDDDEISLYKKINEWNLENSKFSNDNIEKIRKLNSKLNENSDDNIETSDLLLKLNESEKQSEKSNINKSNNSSFTTNEISYSQRDKSQESDEKNIDVKNLTLKDLSTNSDKKSISEYSIDSNERKKSARDKILARVKGRTKNLIEESAKPKIIVPAGFNIANLPNNSETIETKISNDKKPKINNNISRNENEKIPSLIKDLSNERIENSSISMLDKVHSFLKDCQKSIYMDNSKNSSIMEDTSFEEPLSAFEIQPFQRQSNRSLVDQLSISKSNSVSHSIEEQDANKTKISASIKSEEIINKSEGKCSDGSSFAGSTLNYKKPTSERSNRSFVDKPSALKYNTSPKKEMIERQDVNRKKITNPTNSEKNVKKSDNKYSDGGSISENKLNYRRSPNNSSQKPNDRQRTNLNSRYNQTQNKRKDGMEQLDEICVPTSAVGKDSVMVHGVIPIPIYTLAEAQFTPYVHNQMEMMGHKSIYRVQQYSWPHILRFNSLILVNGERSGKTFAYLPAVCSLIEMENENNETVENGKGPMAIIVLSTRSEGEQVLRLCRYFTKKIAFCSDQQNCAEALSCLLKPTDILVCTPNGIKELEEKNKRYRWFSKDRLKHFIIENIDIWPSEKLTILNKVMDDFSIKKLDNLQIILTSRIWMPFFKSFLKLKSFNNPLICMGAYIEAAIYANTEFVLKIVKNNLKLNCVLDFLKKHYYEDEKTVILCNSNEDVEFLAENLRGLCINVSYCTNESSLDELNVIRSDWDNSSTNKRSVLICSDNILSDLEIRDAQNLIHYSLSSSWTKTCYRFSVFLKYHENKLIINDKTQVFSESTQEPAKTLILLDENNNEHLPKLINFLDRNQIIIDETIRKLVKIIQIEREKIYHTEIRPFCSKYLEFGKYHNVSQCKGRHIMTANDKPAEDLPTEGEIKFQLISVDSPTIYQIRILEHKELNSNSWHPVKQSQIYASFFMKFNMYFRNSDNHQTYFPIVKHEICVAVEKGEFYRCQILEINKVEVNGVIDYNVRAKLLDVGSVMTFKSAQLLILPKKFSEFPFQAVELRLLGIVPYDKEEVWDKKTALTVRNWFERYSKEKNMIITSVIQFTLMNTIFVKEITMKSELSAIKTYVDKIYVKRNLIEKKLVEKDTEIENNIKMMAYDVDLLKQPKENLDKMDKNISSNNINQSHLPLNESRTELRTSFSPKTDIIINKTDKNVINERKVILQKETWCSLIGNKCSRINVTVFNSPDIFYIQLKDEQTKLEKLSSKITEYMKNNSNKPVLEPTLGLNCLAKYNEHYCRCKVIGMISENFQLLVTVFFVDIGALQKLSPKNIFRANEEIFNIIPFQAMQCSLVGISSKTLDGLWKKTESQNIYEKFIKSCNSLYARPMLEESPKENSILKYWSYKIILLDGTDKKYPIQINTALYVKGLATKDPDTEHFLDMVDTIEKQSEKLKTSEDNCSSDSEYEEWKSDEDREDFDYSKIKENHSEHEFDVNFDETDIEGILEALGLPKTTKLITNDKLKDDVSKNKQNTVETLKIKDDKSVKSSAVNNSVDAPLCNTVSKYNDESKSSSKLFLNNLKSISQNFKGRRSAIKSHDSSNKTPKIMPLLKYSYNIPKVVWRQTEDIISLYIYAPNIEDYELKVSQTNLIFIADIESKLNVLCLNLFGSIDFVSHEIRGLSVVVRFKKTMKGKDLLWPRLTKETDKHLWLKYNIDSLITETESQENLAFKKTSDEHFKDSEDEWSGSCDGIDENYDKVLNTEDIYDPFIDI